MQEIVVIDGEITLENVLDGEVELEAITDLDPEVVLSAGGGITPSGTIEITANGVYDVTEYASADVDVQGGITPTGTKQISITANGTITEDVTNYADVEVTTAVPASAVDTGTKSITTNGTHDVVGYASANVAVPASAVDSGTKSITSNGTHDVIGYASASVAVPNSYSASDEGKVVSNGALVAQTSDTVTANDTYDTTLINSLTVNVSGGGGSTKVAKGSFTLANDFSLTTSAQTLPGLDLDFQPDILIWIISRNTFANLAPSGQHIYGMFAVRKLWFPYMYNSIVSTVTSDYQISIWQSVASYADSPSGYVLDRFSNVGSSYYPRFDINADGTVSVGRFSSASSSIYAGTYDYYAIKF